MNNVGMGKRIKFILNGCDISFVADAPADMTIEQLIKQADRIHPDWCACGVCSASENSEIEISFDYNDVRKVGDPPCRIEEKA